MTQQYTKYFIIFIWNICRYAAQELESNGAENAETAEHESEEKLTSYSLFKWKWEEVQYPVTMTLWVLLAAYGKILFNLSKRVSEHLPDSALLIVLGLIIGAVLMLLNVPSRDYELSSTVFFLYLLPPIVFDAGYFMPSRAFFENLGTILVYAVIGTLWNTFSIALGLYICDQLGLFSAHIEILHILLFSALISAVDPVAVLCVFEEIQVNEVLFIIVFGESLLNDAITVVLYNIFNDFSQIHNNTNSIAVIDIVAGVSSFFTVGLGGILVGVIWATICSFTTRFTSHVKILNPLFVFLIPYLAYLSAEMVGLSSIMAIVFCGIFMKQYVKENIGDNARVAIKYMIKMFSSSSEAVIFMFLGLSTIGSAHNWDIGFIIATLFLCLFCRALGVLIQTYFLNKQRIRKFSVVDHVIMAYGGLRGAVAYGLVVAIRPDTVGIENRARFITACEMVILFTVFIQGATIKPLVNCLKVEKADHRELSINESMFERWCDRTLAGIEDVCGFHGHHWLRHIFDHYNTKYLKPLFMRHEAHSDDMKIVRSFQNLERQEALGVAQEYKRQQSKESNGTVHDKADGNNTDHDNSVVNPAYEGSQSVHQTVRFNIDDDFEDDSKDMIAHAFRPKYRRLSRYYINDEESKHDMDEFKILRRRQTGRPQKSDAPPKRRQPAKSVYNVSSATRNSNGTNDQTESDKISAAAKKPRSMSLFVGNKKKSTDGADSSAEATPTTRMTPRGGILKQAQQMPMQPLAEVVHNEESGAGQSRSTSDRPSSISSEHSDGHKRLSRMPTFDEEDIDDNAIVLAEVENETELTNTESNEGQSRTRKSSF